METENCTASTETEQDDQFYSNIVAEILENQRHAEYGEGQKHWNNDVSSGKGNTEVQSKNVDDADPPLVIKTEICDDGDTPNFSRTSERLPSEVLEVSWPAVEATGTMVGAANQQNKRMYNDIPIKVENEGCDSEHINNVKEHQIIGVIKGIQPSYFVNRRDNINSVASDEEVSNVEIPNIEYDRFISEYGTNSSGIEICSDLNLSKTASANVLRCTYCNKSFKLKMHLHRHNCDKRLNTKPYIEKHDHGIHEKSLRISVKRLNRNKNLRHDEHVVSSSKSLYRPTCDFCNKSFQHKHMLNRHKQTCKIHKHKPAKPKSKIRTLDDRDSKHHTTQRNHSANGPRNKSAKLNVKMKKLGDRPSPSNVSTETHQCVICDESFRRKQALNRHMYMVHGNTLDRENSESGPIHKEKKCKLSQETMPRCDTCDKIFSYKKSLNHHIRTVHRGTLVTESVDPVPMIKQTVYPSSNEKIHQCDLCEKSFGHKDSLRRHKRAYHGNKFVTCKVCSKTFSCKSELDRHKVHHFKQIKESDCAICEKKCADLENLLQHLMDHSLEELKKFAETSFEMQIDSSNKERILEQIKENIHLLLNRKDKEGTGNTVTYACDLCDKTFTHSRSLARHKSFHEGTYRMCETCGKTFPDISGLNRHKVIHSDEKPFKCELCDERFKLQFKLTDHMYIHKPRTCDVEGCSKTFTSGLAYKRHKRVHKGNYMCETCGKAFGSMYALKFHQVIHSDVEAFECEFCSRKFKLKKHLTSHKLYLHNDTPLICDVEGCGETFKHRRGFLLHKRFHGGKYIVCETCGKPFGCVSELNKHKLMHSTEKPCECDLCDGKFAVPYRLKLHKLNCHTPHVCDSKGCKKKFRGRTSFLRHKKKFHSKKSTDSSDESLDENEKLMFSDDVRDEREENTTYSTGSSDEQETDSPQSSLPEKDNETYPTDSSNEQEKDSTRTSQENNEPQELSCSADLSDDSLAQYGMKEQEEEVTAITEKDEKLEGLISFPSDSLDGVVKERGEGAQKRRMTQSSEVEKKLRRSPVPSLTDRESQKSTFCCNYCSKAFWEVRFLEQHIKNKHPSSDVELK